MSKPKFHLWTLTLTCIVGWTFGSVCYSQTVFSPAISYKNQSSSSSRGTPESITQLDLRLGYTYDFGLYLGGLYSLGSESSDAPQGLSSSDFAFGASFGFKKWQAYGIITYLFFAEKDLKKGNAKYSAANGVQVDLGYLFSIYKGIKLGPQITYKKLTYNNYDINGLQQTAQPFETDNWLPYITLWLDF